MKFVDEVTITVASGNGGPGCVSFRRESGVPRGGPDGGDGGKGGDVIFCANSRLSSLLDLKFKKKYKAGNGRPGEGQNRSGADGEDLTIDVPPGTMIRDRDGRLVADLKEGETFTYLKGGLGGRGNTYYKSSIQQAPQKAQKGLPGEENEVKLELKLLADVGIIGFPNAGKSTLISHISAAKPKVADYPFTTLVPNLGVVRYGDERTFVVADIPGLIAGAHKGVGLGTQFLRHIERTRVFVHMIDATGMSGQDPIEAYKEINEELRQYDESKAAEEGFEPLSEREQLVVLNKIDAISDQDLKELKARFKKELGIDELYTVSAATGKNLKELVFATGRRVFHEHEE